MHAFCVLVLNEVRFYLKWNSNESVKIFMQQEDSHRICGC
jgi:hypothetical protein